MVTEESLMLDVTDGTLHKPLSISLKAVSDWGMLTTSCGLTLTNVTIGPFDYISEKALRRCPDCFPDFE